MKGVVRWSPRVRLGQTQLPKGTAMGVAFHFSHQGYFAEVAEVKVDAANKVKVNKVWVAADVGRQIINPGAADNIVQGGIIDGLSELMAQEITLEKAAWCRPITIKHPMMRLTQSPPEIEVHYLSPITTQRVWASRPAADSTGPRQRHLHRDSKRVRALPFSKSEFSWRRGLPSAVVAFLLLLTCTGAFAQDERRVASPNGQLEFRIFVAQPEDGALSRLLTRSTFAGAPDRHLLPGSESEPGTAAGESAGLMNPCDLY